MPNNTENKYHKKFQDAVADRARNKIDSRLAAADSVWNDSNSTSDKCENHEDINHLKKKIWTLFSILSNQLKRDGENSVYLDPIAPDIEDLSEDIANEVMDDIIRSQKEGNTNVSFESFVSLVEALYRRHLSATLNVANRQLAKVEDELQLSLFHGSNLKEIKKILLDFCMYPNCFAVGAYKVKEKERVFRKGRIHATDKTSYKFHRVSPWNVFPVDSRANNAECQEYFIVEDYCKESLKLLKTKAGANKANINSVLADHKKYDLNWYVQDCKDNFPKLSVENIPVVKFFGMVDGSYGEVWLIGGKEIYKTSGNDDAAIVVTASFRPDNDNLWGSGLVDIGWKLQKTINKLSEMGIDNIGYRAKPGGLLAQSIAKAIARNSEPTRNAFKKDGAAKLEYDRFYTVPDDVLRSLGKGIINFDIPDRTQQIQLAIEYRKREIDSLVGIPAFADGSQNVGTLGRSAKGLLVVQSNLMNTIDTSWDHFGVEILVELSKQIINGNFLANSNVPVLNFDVIVRPFYNKEEDIADADEIIKQVSAILQFEQSGLATPGSAQPLADRALDLLGVDSETVDTSQAEVQVEQQAIEQSQATQPQQSTVLR